MNQSGRRNALDGEVVALDERGQHLRGIFESEARFGFVAFAANKNVEGDITSAAHRTRETSFAG